MIDKMMQGFITPNLVCPSIIQYSATTVLIGILLWAFRIVLILLVNKYNSVNFSKPAHLECWLLFYDILSDKIISK